MPLLAPAPAALPAPLLPDGGLCASIDDGVGPNAIARDNQFGREYLARMRDCKGPKHKP